MPPKGFPTTHFDMYLAEDIGFEKLDILSQRGIGHIKDTAEIVWKNRGIKVDVHEVQKFKTDEKVREQLKSGDTIGCFYIESPAMRGLLKKLHCDDYLTLVAASSIIRPGVARSGMMKEFILRFNNPGSFQVSASGYGRATERNLRCDGVSGRCAESGASFWRSRPGRCRCVATDDERKITETKSICSRLKINILPTVVVWAIPML